jgi:hypothetical protein
MPKKQAIILIVSLILTVGCVKYKDVPQKEISIESQAKNVLLVIEENPELMMPFLREAITVAMKDDSGIAIQLEQYASEEVKKEIDRWKKDSDISSLLKLEQKIKELSLFEEECVKLEEKCKALEAKLDLQGTNGVPVIISNTWSVTDCSFYITNKKTNKEFTFFLPACRVVTIQIPPGDYSVIYSPGTTKRIYRSERIKVTTYPSAKYAYSVCRDDGIYETVERDGHALIITPP